MIRGDFHIHSNHSDGHMKPRTILKVCRKLRMNTIAITDHDTMSGFVEAKKHAKEFEIEVLPGEEILTDAGDIIALNIARPIEARQWEIVIEEIHAQGGLAIMPHPYRSHENVEAIGIRCDLIETFNGRTPEAENRQAKELAMRLAKPPIAGSDAHVLMELGRVINEFDSFRSFNKLVVHREDTKARSLMLEAMVRTGGWINRLRK